MVWKKRKEWSHLCTEEVIRLMPDMIRDKNALESEIESEAAFPSGSGDFVSGGIKRTQQERFLCNPSLKMLNKLERIITVLINGFFNLSDDEKCYIFSTCFKDVYISDIAEYTNKSDSWVRRCRKSGFFKMKNSVLEVMKDVEDWKRWREKQTNSSLEQEGIKGYSQYGKGEV